MSCVHMCMHTAFPRDKKNQILNHLRTTIAKVIAYCNRFPSALVRWSSLVYALSSVCFFWYTVKTKHQKNEAPRHPHRTLIIDPFKTQNYHHGLCQEVEVRYWSQGVLRGNLHQANHSQHWTVQAAGGVRRWWCSAAKRKPVLSSNYKPKHIGFIRQLKEKEFEKPMAHQDAPLALADEECMTPEPERLGDKALLYLQHYSPYIDRA